jgi:hypothetical protein
MGATETEGDTDGGDASGGGGLAGRGSAAVQTLCRRCGGVGTLNFEF